ncbi:MAG TPA: hypothetical protein PKD72_03445 [Gemmatales bacterium]|nr:hypothetical protein [Gemmatales bacterium]
MKSASSKKAKVGPKKSTASKVSKTSQKKVAASAKKSVLKVSGKTTRVIAHTQAANQRKQARRDSKN